MFRSLRIVHFAITAGCIAVALPAMAQVSDPAPSHSKSPKVNASTEPAPAVPTPSVSVSSASPSDRATPPSTASEAEMQEQIYQLQNLLGVLNQRLDHAETMAAVQASPWTGDPSTSAACTNADCPHHCGDTASGSVCNYYHRFNWSEDAYVSVGAGVRTSFVAAQDQAANGTSYSRDQVLDNMRLYFNGRGHKYIGFEMNTDVENFYLRPFVTDDSALQFRLLDAIAKIRRRWRSELLGRTHVATFGSGQPQRAVLHQPCTNSPSSVTNLRSLTVVKTGPRFGVSLAIKR